MLQRRSSIFPGALLLVWSIAIAQVVAHNPQTPPAAPQGGPPRTGTPPAGQPPSAGQPPPAGPPRRAPDYPERAAGDPAAIERGKTSYSVSCRFCHGADARGGDGGPSLIRSQLVLNDKSGELIGPVVQNGRPDRGMPKFDVTNAQAADLAAFIHSFKVAGYDESRMTPTSILVGNATTGRAFFDKTCGSCHSATGDLSGIGGKWADAKVLQQTWLMPGFGRGGAPASELKVPPTTVTVTLPTGERYQGRLRRIDDFIITLIETDGTPRTFNRDGASPTVEVHDPLKPHRDLLRVYTDANIHDVTAYLVTVK